MKIYHYDENGLYVGTSDAELDPAEWQINHQKVYIVPAGATEIKPPKTNKNQIAKFEGNNWVVYPDYRGQYIVNSEMNTNMVADIGELPDGYILITEAQYNKITEDKFYYIVAENKLCKNPNYDNDKAKAEQESIGQLTLTRDNPLIDVIGAKLGLTSEDLDYLFKNKELPQGDKENG